MVLPAPPEVRALLARRASFGPLYDEARAAAEALVVRWRWTRGWVPVPEQAYWAERYARKPGRLLRKKTGDQGTELGFDAEDRVAVELHHSGHSEPWTQMFRVDDDLSATYVFERYDWLPPERHLQGVALRQILRDGDGRIGGIATARHERDHWHLERYVRDTAGRVIAIEETFSEYGESGLSYRLEVVHRSDGSVDRIDAVYPDGRRSPVYAQLDAAIGDTLAAIERDLQQELSALLASPDAERLWALALAYVEDDPLPPQLVVCTQRERQSWTPGGDRDWHLLNTAEWDDIHAPSWALSSGLAARCRAASAALSANEQQHQGAALLRRVARNLNEGPLLAYAREVRGAAERLDLRDSLPPERYQELKRLRAL